MGTSTLRQRDRLCPADRPRKQTRSGEWQGVTSRPACNLQPQDSSWGFRRGQEGDTGVGWSKDPGNSSGMAEARLEGSGRSKG